MPTVGAITCRSKTGSFKIPEILPASMPGNVAVAPCPAAGCQVMAVLHPNFSQTGGPYTSSSPPCTFSWSLTLTQIGDNGDGTWQYRVNVSATVTGTPTLGGVWLTNSNTSTNYANGSTINLPYLAQVIDPSVYVVSIQIDVTYFPYTYLVTNTIDDGPPTTGVFDPGQVPGFAYWNGDQPQPPFNTGTEADYVLACCRMDSARWAVPAVCTGTMQITRATTLTGLVSFVLMEWSAHITGLVVGTTYSVYFHFDWRNLGGGSWITNAIETEVTFTAASTEMDTPFIGSEWFGHVGPTFTPPWVYPDPYAEVQLNHVDFTP